MYNPSYIYTSSDKETKRLNTQSELIKEASIQHLQKANLSIGQTVADIGCGSGIMTAYIAEQVGPSGHVYAIDIDKKQIEVARQTLSEKNLTNVTFIQCDFMIENPEELNKLVNTVDLIYMRFVLMHLIRPDVAIKNMRTLLKIGGLIASQESIIGSTHCEELDSAEICEAYGISLALGNKLGVDKNIGNRLVDLYQESGFVNMTFYKVTHVIPMKDAAPVILQAGEDGKKLMLQHNLTTEEQFEKHRTEITRLGQVNDRSLVFDQGYIIVQNL